MELINFIKNNNIKNYDEFKLVLENEPFFLKFKEDSEIPELFLIYPQEQSDFTNIITRQCNGIIMEKNTLKIICYSLEKCIDDDTKLDERINTENMTLEFAIEGAMVRLYFYNNNWYLATKKCINASKAKWLSNKNFLELFIECLSSINNLENLQEKLNKEYCYTFILVHPENNIVVNNLQPCLYHISTRNLSSLSEIDENIGINKCMKKNFSIDEFNLLLESLKNEQNYSYEGYMIIDNNNYVRQKFKTNIYKMIRDIWGNTNNRFFRYLELRKNFDLLNNYLLYFPQDRNKFFEFEEMVNKLAFKILECYKLHHIFKEKNKIPFYFSKIIYKLHGDFMKNRIMTSHEKVMITLLELDPKQICFMINKLNSEKEKENNLENMDIEG
jgi:hypothetical protein